MAPECATHFIGSLYKFSVVGRREVLKSFADAVTAQDVSCEALTRGNVFKICCPFGDEDSPATFTKLVKEFTADKRDNEDMFEEPMAMRMKGTQVQADAPASMATRPSQPTSEGHLIDHEHITRSFLATRAWIPDKSGRQARIQIDDDLLPTIGDLCNCRIERPDDMSSTIVVKGDTEQNIERAFQKLKVMEQATIHRVLFPRILSFPIMEGHIHCQIVMKPLKVLYDSDRGERRVNTTLLQPNSQLRKSFRRALVICIILSRYIVVPKQVRLQHVDGVSLLWEARPLRQAQMAPIKQAMPTTTPNDATPDIPKSPTGEWVASIPLDPNSFVDAFQGPKEAQVAQVNEVTYKQPLAQTLPRPSTKRRRVAKGALAAGEAVTKAQTPADRDNEFSGTTSQPVTERAKSLLLLHLTNIIKEEAPQEKSQSMILPHLRDPGNKQPSEKKKEPLVESLDIVLHKKPSNEEVPWMEKVDPGTQSGEVLPDNEQSLEEKIERSIPSIQLLPDKKSPKMQQALEEKAMPSIQSIDLLSEKPQALEQQITPNTQSVRLPPHLRIPGKVNQSWKRETGSERTLVGTGSRTASSDHGPPITTPYLPRLSASSAIEPHPLEREWQLVDRGRVGQLIDISTPIEEKVQDPHTASKHSLKRTMNQKAPSHKLPASNIALLKSFDDQITQLLNMVLGFQGPIDLEVGLGRLLIDPDKGSNEFKDKAFNASEWSSAFSTTSSTNPNPNPLETVFTPRLTTSSSDAQSILEIDLSHGRKLFNLPEVGRKVSYILVCKTKEEKQISIDVAEDRTFKVLGSKVFVGALDWHFPKRSFDARLSLNVHEFLLRDYHQQAQALVNSMTISTSSDQYAVLDTQLKDQELAILSIHRERATFYTNRTYPDSLLHLREVQEFELSSSGSEYRGVLLPSKEMINANKLWWEATITSASAKDMMKESETLELGEMATWSPEAVVNKGVVQDLHNLTKEVVTQIDHIGFDNKGPKGNSGAQSMSYQKSVQSDQKSAQKSMQTTMTTPTSYW